MNLQHQRIAELPQALKLERGADHYSVLAAGREEFSFGDFLEQLLLTEELSPATQPQAADANGLFTGDQGAGGVRLRLQSRRAQDTAA